jgi:DNA-binding transcriptional LysR family regulator
MIDIHKLNAFVAVVEESNISKAAVRLHMQQPPLTRLIQSLEQELDTQLLKRLPRGVEATEAGKVLYQEAITILAHAQSIPRRVQNIAQGKRTIECRHSFCWIASLFADGVKSIS